MSSAALSSSSVGCLPGPLPPPFPPPFRVEDPFRGGDWGPGKAFFWASAETAAACASLNRHHPRLTPRAQDVAYKTTYNSKYCHHSHETRLLLSQMKDDVQLLTAEGRFRQRVEPGGSIGCSRPSRRRSCMIAPA